jgi:hypothetical protein
MLSALATVLLVVVVGARAGDSLRLRQQEAILAKLTTADARAYYDVLRRRVRRVRVMRAIALLGLGCLLYAIRHGLLKNAT